MNSIDLDVLKTAIAWSESGAYTLLATVVRTWGSAPRPVGSMMVMRGDGHVRGSISGGCIEDDLIHQVQTGHYQREAGELPTRTLTYGLSADEAHRFGLPCGGTLQLVIERVTDKSRLRQLIAYVEKQGLVTRRLTLANGEVQLERGMPDTLLQHDEHTLVTAHGPRYRLILIGAGQLSSCVAQMAGMLDYEIVVCDPREEYLKEWDIAGVQLSREMPDDLLIRLELDAHSAVLTLTHDPKLDDMALLEALKSPAFYIGAIGSRGNNAKRRARLALFDITEAEIARLHGPVGMYIGARTPPEIAVSILAEMTCIRNGAPVLQTHQHRPTTTTPQDATACIRA
ncbi:XdhC family protein [Herbaspirillum sp. VT-16-41]|uniref:XdhC family protein n=1 Tax=Herbaspirillum sp. VT-16-41 TaxID=1953765 RepID=UPI00098226E5|nr:XdhC family protein [Herbaspirillum sp. VT-16-41]ONN64894.1 hypothetical protein BTM36_18880 [Herbaspirillum sp. VT-16-41]